MSIAMLHRVAKKHLHRSWPLVLVMVVAFGFLNLVAITAGNASKPVTTSSLVATEEVRVLLANVRRHLQTKENEQPTVATIRDADSLRALNPVFYKDAHNGDRVIVWTDKAVLYSSVNDVVVAVATFGATPRSDASAQMAIQPKAEAAVIEVQNGTRTKGLAADMSRKLESAGLSVVRIGDAPSKDYRTTRIINVGNRPLPTTLETLKRVTGAAVDPATAKQREAGPDFIVIVGADYSSQGQ